MNIDGIWTGSWAVYRDSSGYSASPDRGPTIKADRLAGEGIRVKSNLTESLARKVARRMQESFDRDIEEEEGGRER